MEWYEKKSKEFLEKYNVAMDLGDEKEAEKCMVEHKTYEEMKGA